MEWFLKGSPPPKNFKTQLSASEIMTIALWNSEGVIYIDFLPHYVTISTQY
jgi:hypothetical protein